MKRFAAIFVMTLVLSATFSSRLPAQEGQRVAVTPFNIQAQGAQLEQLSRLSQGLLDVTVQGLGNQGFIPVAMSDTTRGTGEDAARAQARELGADYLFTASMTRVEDRFNLTGNLIALNSQGRSSGRVSVTSNTTEDLPQTVERLVLMATDHLYGSGVKVVSVQIVGNSIIDNQAILNALRIRVGGTYNDAKASSDLRRIYSMGYFDDVQVEANDVGGGKAVSFIVTERSQLGAINFTGNTKLDDDDLLSAISIKPYDIPNEQAIAASVAEVQRVYANEGFPQVLVNTALDAGDDGRTVLTYHITEGDQIYVKDILFDGNEHFSSWTLSGQIDSSTKGFLSWISGSGKLDREKLSNDARKLEAYYHNNGFLSARVGDPSMTFEEDGGLVAVFPIVEGPRFKVGQITLGGSLLPDDDPEELIKEINLRNETYFNREMLQDDVQRLQTYYSDMGYAQNQVEPRLSQPDAENFMDVEFRIDPKNQVYFDRITIVGNEKTRDKVVRRQLSLAEGDLFSATKLRDSHASLMRSTYFDEVNLVPGPSESDGLMNLRVEVKERPTGSFQVGGGYSSYNSLFGLVRIAQDNLFGYGRRVNLEANIGDKSNYYNFSFTDPWVGDIPLTMGLDIFNYYMRYDYYRKNSTGAALRFGYPIYGNFYLSARYAWENIDITDVGTHSSAVLRDMQGFSNDSTINLTLRRDTRNHFFYPTEGSTMRLSYTLGSQILGGDTSFSRYEAEGAFWLPMPLIKDAAFMAHGEVGFARANQAGGLPVYEKYMIGGIDSIRGYDWYSISPKDPVTNEIIGGTKMMLFNVELTFPLLKDEGLHGVFFYDAGNVWDASKAGYDFGDLRQSYGVGLRYLSPLGPFRIEYGRPVSPREGESSGRWEFTMGSMF